MSRFEQAVEAARNGTDKFKRDPRLADFRNFLFLVWKFLGLPEPTALQYDYAYFLQYGPDRQFACAFRGFGKSFIAAAFETWRLYWDPENLNALIVSGSKSPADDISTFIMQLISGMPELDFLSMEGRERHSKISFDVGPALPNKHPSVKSVGITGQITGSRADDVLADDVETFNNSLTQGSREKISEAIKEFDSVVKPGGTVRFLGTPQTEESIYLKLKERGYAIRIWPAEYPDEKLLKAYGDRLAPIIRDAVLANPALAGTPTEPTRFNELELRVRLASYGRSGYALQFQLDTSLSDAERYPLKLRDLIVADIDVDVGPEKLIWTNMPSKAYENLPAVGFSGDRYYAPIVPDNTIYVPYHNGILAVDPAGHGKDETAICVMKQLHGQLFVPECTGLFGGYDDSTLMTIATIAKRNKVNLILVEGNFGDEMFAKLLQQYLQRIYPCSIEIVKHHIQKERRILDVLEPVVQQHRLIIAPAVVLNDPLRGKMAQLSTEQAARYQLFYQFTHITRDRGCLAHDDRIDALAIAAAFYQEAMARDVDKARGATRDAMLEREIANFHKHTFDIKGPRRQRSWLDDNRTFSGMPPSSLPSFG